MHDVHHWSRRPVCRIIAAIVTFASLCCGEVSPAQNASEPALAVSSDQIVRQHMARDQIAGLTLTIVQNERVVIKRGYGFADIERRISVDPDRTLFPVASVTKTFTATAIMQLVQQGKIDLNADVNRYLDDMKIPSAFGVPVRVRDLVTHRAGFEDRVRNSLVVDPAKDISLVQWLKANPPDRVRPPGVVTSYSNYGMALAGHIVERVSGEPFERYLEKHIFIPLGMVSTTARRSPGANRSAYPISPELLDRIARPYRFTDGQLRPLRFDFRNPRIPAGGIKSTSADMGQWMLAHLGDGAVNGARILSPASAQVMRVRPYPDRSEAPDYGIGFRTARLKGYNTLEHGGGLPGYNSSMIMVPALGIGVFVAASGGDPDAPRAITLEILDKMVTGPKPTQALLPMDAQQAQAFVGTYMTTRRAYTSWEKLFTASDPGAEVSFAGGNKLFVSVDGERADYERIGPRLFRKPGSEDLASFDMSGGRAIRFYGPAGSAAYERVPANSNAVTLLATIALTLVMAPLTLAALWRRRRKEKVPATRRVDILLVVASLTALVTVVLLVLAAVQVAMMGDLLYVNYPTWLMPVTSVAAIATIACSGLVIVGSGLALVMPGYSRLQKLNVALFASTLAMLSLHLLWWRVAGFRY
jgi:CubicO group peptidase (beta-lactamase class C family)